MTKVYLDDERTPKVIPFDEIIRNSWDFFDYIKEHGCPDYISFDHDLGDESNDGYEIVKQLVTMDILRSGKLIPENFTWHVHSANPVGRDNINKYLEQYLEFKKTCNWD